MKNKKFMFSVIMAIYNVEKYLEEAILSVINQSLSFEENIQLILVNDGSPDNCHAICKKYEKKYPSNIIYIKKENGGVSSARNAGLEVATGKYINFLDSDDYFSENAFYEVKEFFEKNYDKTDVVAINLINFENSEGSWVNGSFFEKTQLIDMKKDSNFIQCQVGASFIKSDVAKKYRFDTNMKIHEDSHYLYRIFCENPYCGVISNATYWHRIRANGTSATQTIKHKTNIFSLTEKLFRELIDIFKKKYEKVPAFLQTFIILEFNYYVVNKANQCKFTKEEKEKLNNNLTYILDNIDEENIINHFVLQKHEKERLLEIKKNVNKIYKNNKVSKKIREIINLGKRKINSAIKIVQKKNKKIIYWFPRKIKNRILKSVIERIESLEYKTSQQQLELLINKTIFETSSIVDNIINEKQNIKSYIDNNILEIHKLKTEILELKNEIKFYDDLNIKYCLYFHGGSRNHGCEALVRTISDALSVKRENLLLHTFRKSEDVAYRINEKVKYIEEPRVTDFSKKIFFMGETTFNNDMGVPQILPYLNKDSIAISIGGDNYCYGSYVTDLLKNYNDEFHKACIKTALIGCSIEPEVLKDQNVLRDLNNYDLILARESITYNVLIKSGINKNTHLVPDTAFMLEKVELELPSNFIENNTIGINISPYVSNNEDNIVYKNYIKLIEYIINKTKYNVAIIPHVFWNGSNDMDISVKIYNMFCNTGRICLISEHNCEELKGYISRCKMFIGARTHATIAAYSSFVPTIAVGYSIKSKGIATDLFGTYEKYVLAIENFSKETELIDSFIWLEKNSNKIRNHLKKLIPDYIKPIKDIPNYFDKLRNSDYQKELPYKPNCNGCSACMSVCPQKCINMDEDNEGFYYPIVDYSKCTHCNLCKKICPRNNQIENNFHANAYAVKNKDLMIRNASSSGGVFTEIASYVLKNGGVVFGAAFNDNMQLEHIMVSDIKDLEKLQGSKYLQSNMKSVFTNVKKQLDNNKLVLFSGVPCQIQGLKQFLQKEYSNLICVDVICHGVPSPKVFSKYLSKMESETNSKIIGIDFRNKEEGWKNYNVSIKFKNNVVKITPYNQDIYMIGFLQNLYLRPSCSNCTANNFRSKSDITLGDYWGIEKIHSDFDDNKGTSLVLLNTELGKDIFKKISNKFEIIKTDINFAIQNNPSIIRSWNHHKNRERFFENIENFDITQNINESLNN